MNWTRTPKASLGRIGQKTRCPMNRNSFIILTVLLGSLRAVMCAGDEKSADTTPETKTPSPLRKLMDESLSWNELFANDRSATPMTAKVVLRWTNNTRGSEDGMTVLYLADGRPEAVCCFYPWEKSLIHEFDSLSRGTLMAKRDGAGRLESREARLTVPANPRCRRSRRDAGRAAAADEDASESVFLDDARLASRQRRS